MADNPFEVPQSMRDLAEQNLKQAEASFGQFTDFMTQAMGAWMGGMPSNSMATGTKNVQDQAMEFVTLQAQFAQERMQAFFTQTQELYSAVQEASQKREEAAARPAPSNATAPDFKDIQSRIVAMARKNADATLALVEKVAKAQNTQEILALQTKFVQEQMQAFVAQAQELFALLGQLLRAPRHG